jgi:protein-S-isoprenylcysteine O-methyltransferase Ste14
MDIKLIIIIGFSYLYGGLEVFMNWRQRGQGQLGSAGDKCSLWALYGSITLGYFLSFAVGATKTGRINPWNTFFAIGAALIVPGLLIRIHSMLTLKQYFTYAVVKVADHQLVETGLYKFIRHPGYLGQIMIFLGISISLSNWLSVLVMLLPVALGYGYRINVEERFMLEQLGKKYLAYQQRTKRLIPLVF